MPSRQAWLFWITGVIAAPYALGAQAISDGLLAGGGLSFSAQATLGDFIGTTHTATGKLIGAPRLNGVHGWVEAPAKSLTTLNDHRDRDMASSLEVEKYSTIRFDLDSVVASEPFGDSTAVVLIGKFTLHGQTHAASVSGFAKISSSLVKFRGAIPLNVKDFGIGGLSKMFGLLKMKETIIVSIDIWFTQTHE